MFDQLKAADSFGFGAGGTSAYGAFSPIPVRPGRVG